MYPSPVQRGQAPWGELNEKARGSISTMVAPCSGHANRSEYSQRRGGSAPPTSSATTRPSLSPSAVSTLSVSRRRRSSRMRRRSTTTETSCGALPVEGRRLLERVRLAVDRDPGEALAAQPLEQVPVLALAPADDRRQQLEARALGHLEQPVDDLFGALAADRPAALRAMGRAHPGPQETQVVVHLGDRRHRGAGVAAGRLLVDRDRRREPLDRVDVRLVHLPEELARVRGQALDVPPLPLGVEGVEGEARLAASGQPGDHDEGVAGDLQVDVAQVVFAGTAHDDRVAATPTVSARGHFAKCSDGATSAAGRRPRAHRPSGRVAMCRGPALDGCPYGTRPRAPTVPPVLTWIASSFAQVPPETRRSSRRPD